MRAIGFLLSLTLSISVSPVNADTGAKAHWIQQSESREKPPEAVPTKQWVVEKPTYIGIDNCKVCHMPHYDSWSTTRMSRAFELLKPGVRSQAKAEAGLDPEKDYTRNADCLKCHVTGYGKPGGFISLEQTPRMANVQCEMCHGPGSLYAEMMLKKKGSYSREDFITLGGMIMPSAESNVCTGQCHNHESPFIPSGFDFDFENRKAMGTHRHDIQYIDMPFDW